LPWTVNPAGTNGFSGTGTAEPWLPVPLDWGSLSVEAQSDEDGSVLHLCRRALQLRAKLHRDGVTAADDEVTWERTGNGRLVAARDGGISLVLAMGEEAVPLPDGDILIASVPLTPDGRLPADGAAWLLRPER
jgi:alpha-glucosidase